MGASAYDRLGGEFALRAIIDDFVDRIFDDAMIGFFFLRADRARVKEKEFELASGMLGGPHRYTGRPLPDAHAPHRIMGGQFARRRKLLEETLQAHGAPRDIIETWLAHTDRLRGQVTRQSPSECID